MTWRDCNSAQELLKAINNPEVGIAGSQLPKTGERPSLAHPSEPKPHKYHIATKEDRTYNGIVFHSKKEAQFAQELDLRIKAGSIDFWLRQVPFTLPGPSVYRLDFMIFTWLGNSCGEGQYRVEYIGIAGFNL